MIIFLLVIQDEEVRNKLEELYILYHKEMFYVAYSILKDSQEAEDVVQEAIIKLSTCMNKIDKANCNKTRGFVVIVVRNIGWSKIFVYKCYS
ncbi:MAG: hypothetical protein GX238_01170 [Epulopiscium sp.]|nr:hypothetical protein [Candidatus Epulonipiscium sp.]